jgi:31-O-methyltransferase
MLSTTKLALPISTLPNGLSVKHVSTQDLRFLYEEIFVQKCYLQHGVQLRPGDVVLDIGADVGV